MTFKQPRIANCTPESPMPPASDAYTRLDQVWYHHGSVRIAPMRMRCPNCGHEFNLHRKKTGLKGYAALDWMHLRVRAMMRRGLRFPSKSVT